MYYKYILRHSLQSFYTFGHLKRRFNKKMILFNINILKLNINKMPTISKISSAIISKITKATSGINLSLIHISEPTRPY